MNIKIKVKEIFFNCLGYIVVAVTCGLYVFTTLFVLTPTNKDIWQIIGEGILAFCLGISTHYLLGVQGVINAMKDEAVVNTMSLYSQTVVKISGKINKLGDWCHDKNVKTYERQRRKILARAGLRYEDCFDSNGIAKSITIISNEKPIIVNEEALKDKSKRKNEQFRINQLKKENRRHRKEYNLKCRCYQEAVSLKLSELYSSNLTSEGGKKDDPNYLGATIGEYLTKSSSKALIARALLAVVFGIYGVALIADFTWASLIWTGFQICVFLCLGIINMQMSYLFITGDYRGRIIKKIDNLEEFDADMKIVNEIKEVEENVEIH